MELDDFKQTWNEAKNSLQEQQTLNPEMLDNMTDQNYQSKVKKIMIPEIAGSIVCLAAAALIVFNFYRLDTNFLQVSGILAILLLLLLPIISTLSTWGLIKADNVNRPYAETLKSFAVQKIRFIKLQKLNATLCYLLLVTIIVLISKLLTGKDVAANGYYWLFSFTIGYILLMFSLRWVEKYYSRSLRQAEELLQDLTA